MKKKYFSYVGILASFLFIILSIVSCHSDTGSATPAQLSVGEMDASVSGFGSFKATNSSTIKSGNSVILKASIPQQNNKNNDSVSISMIIATQGTLPYSIDVSTDAISLINFCIVSYPSGTCIGYQAKKGVGSGTINITSLSPNIEGTFFGTLPSTSGSGSVTITGGAFKALLP